MRQVLSAVLVFGVLTQSATASPDTASVTAQIMGMPLGTNIELRLKNKQKVHGARGATSATGFALVDSHGGEQQIAFNDVASVKLFTVKKHTGRNILIGVGITPLYWQSSAAACNIRKFVRAEGEVLTCESARAALFLVLVLRNTD